jgi:Ser/Thr protein kinase RdoA (MazF antagonist)
MGDRDLTDLSEFYATLQSAYGIREASLERLANSWDGNVYLVSRPESADLILRVVDTESAAHDAEVLTFLEARHYPAPRLVRSAGAPAVTLNNRSILVTTFIEGSAADFWPATLHQLSALLGQLHALDTATAPPFPAASMLPSADMATALTWLAPLESRVSPRLRNTFNCLLEAIHAIAPTEHLPRTLIHNDAHPGNAIVTPGGDATFIDWHGAGLGPPIVDLGFLLISSEIAPSLATPIPPGQGRLEAIVDGYAAHRMPTDDELEWLPDSMQFRALLYGAGHVAQALEQGRDELTETWWWERYLAADALAERARMRFQSHAQS